MHWRSTSRATIRSMMPWTPTNVPPSWILQTCTSRRDWRCCGVDKPTACQTRTVLLSHKTCTLKLIRLPEWLALLDHSGALQLQARVRRVPHPAPQPMENGVDVWQTSRTHNHKDKSAMIRETAFDLHLQDQAAPEIT